jgi:hypothetical protein
LTPLVENMKALRLLPVRGFLPATDLADFLRGSFDGFSQRYVSHFINKFFLNLL